jgi:homogentisate 1,2-dioxygenase
VQHGDSITEIVLCRHPFDVVGWDGYTYPYVLNMLDVEPITGSLHQMPDQYQVFGSASAAVCVMPPHLLDYHPLAVPSPPVHNNVDSDEVMFLVAGTVPGRKAGPLGQITLHPAGLAHGPKDGAYEASVGATTTDLLAFMVDTFEPLTLTAAAAGVENADYYREWLPAE